MIRDKVVSSLPHENNTPQLIKVLQLQATDGDIAQQYSALCVIYGL